MTDAAFSNTADNDKNGTAPQPLPADVTQAANGRQSFASFADELQRMSERMRALSEQLTAEQQRYAALEKEHRYFRRYVYAHLAEQFKNDDVMFPRDEDLEVLIAKSNAQPLETFIGELEAIAEGRA